MRGRKPKSLSQKVLEGNPGKRALKNEPRPTLGDPPMPEGLTADARAEWFRVLPELRKMGILAVCDGADIAGYCQARARWLQAEAIVEKEGPVVDEPVLINGVATKFVRKKKHPAVTVSNQAAVLMKSFAAELGLSPTSRARLDVQAPVDNPGSRLANFLTGDETPVQ